MQLRAETLAPPTPMTSEQLLALAKKLTADANAAANRIRALRLAICADQAKEKPLIRHASDLTGICTHCREWTTVHEPCCGAPVIVDGARCDPFDYCADCGYEKCQCAEISRERRRAAEPADFTEADEHAVDLQRGK